jgi:hypothetical protein
MQLCRLFGATPWPGSVLEQPAVPLLRMLAIIGQGGLDSGGPSAPDHPLANLVGPL